MAVLPAGTSRKGLELMSWYIDRLGTNQFRHCFFKRQRETPEEIQHTINAMYLAVENLP